MHEDTESYVERKEMGKAPPLQRVLASQQKPMAHYGMAHYGASPLRTGEPRAAGDLAGHVPGIAELDEAVVDDWR